MVHRDERWKESGNYDSLLVLTQFKGHTMGGFGGSITLAIDLKKVHKFALDASAAPTRTSVSAVQTDVSVKV